MSGAEDRLLALADELHKADDGATTFMGRHLRDIESDIIAVHRDNQSLRRQIRHLRGVAADLAPIVKQLWEASIKHITPVWTMLSPYLDPSAPMGAEWDVETAAGYETDSVYPPPTEPGSRGTCALCGGEIELIVEVDDNSDEGDSRWVHVHPLAEDKHAAAFGGPA